MTFTRVSKRKAEYEGKQKKAPQERRKKKYKRLFCRKLQCINEKRETTTTKKHSKQNNQKKKVEDTVDYTTD